MQAAWQPMFVWLVWAAMTCNALRFIVRYGSRNVFWDDLWLVFPRLNAQAISWDTLWFPHNEHRIPLPHILQYGFYRATGDARSGLWLIVLVLAGIAFVMIVLQRRLRGKLTWTDAFFPILWLHTGNAENLLMGFQISLMLPTALVSLVMMMIAIAPQGLRPKAAITCASAMICLPLCGGPGFLQAPALAVWALATGFVLRKRADLGSRRSGTVLMVAAVVTAAMLGVYMVGLVTPFAVERTYTVAAVGELTLNVLGLALGPAAETWRPWAGVGVLVFALSGLALAVRACSTTPAERLRAFGIVCCLGANALLALGVGVGRSGSGGPYAYSIRYVMLTAPIVCAAYVSWTLYGPRISSSIVRSGACITWAVAFLFVGYARGEKIGAQRKEVMDALERDIGSGMRGPEIISRYHQWLDEDLDRLFWVYSHMAKLRMEPFDRASEEVIRSFGHEDSGLEPSRVEGIVATALEPGTGNPHGLLLGRQGFVQFAVPEAATKLKLEFAFPGAEEFVAGGVRARLVVIMKQTGRPEREVLLTRTLDSATTDADRVWQEVEIDLPAGEDRRIVIRFMMPVGRDGRILFGRVGDVRFE